jgi:hypothetical protein
MKRSNRRTAPALSKKAPSRARPGGKKSGRSREDLPLREMDTASSREQIRSVNRRVTPSRQSNRRGRSAAGK